MTEPTSSRGRAGLVIAAAALLVAVIVLLVGDNLLGWGKGGDTPEPNESSTVTSSKGSILSDGPVRVFWTGDGETLNVTWDEMKYENLDHYSVDVYGVSPEETWANDGYRLGEELDRFRVIHPAADTKIYYENTGKATSVGPGETWRICVTGQAPSPKDEPNKVVEIEGSKRCSDTFAIPS